METTRIYVTICQTYCNCPAQSDSGYRGDTIEETFESIEQARAWLTDRYGKMPKGRRKMYRDTKDGQSIGFVHSFWTDPWGYEKAQWQTDWVSIEKHVVTPALVA